MAELQGYDSKKDMNEKNHERGRKTVKRSKVNRNLLLKILIAT